MQYQISHRRRSDKAFPRRRDCVQSIKKTIRTFAARGPFSENLIRDIFVTAFDVRQFLHNSTSHPSLVYGLAGKLSTILRPRSSRPLSETTSSEAWQSFKRFLIGEVSALHAMATLTKFHHAAPIAEIDLGTTSVVFSVMRKPKSFLISL